MVNWGETNSWPDACGRSGGSFPVSAVAGAPEDLKCVQGTITRSVVALDEPEALAGVAAVLVFCPKAAAPAAHNAITTPATTARRPVDKPFFEIALVFIALVGRSAQGATAPLLILVFLRHEDGL